MARRAAVAYVDGVSAVPPAAAEDGSNRRAGARLPDPLADQTAARQPGWLARLAQLPAHLGVRWIDVGATVVVMAAVELNVAEGGGQGAAPLDGLAYLLGAILALPVLFRRKWPLGVLATCSLLLLIYYIVHRRNISPAPLLCLPLYDASVAGYLAAAIVIPAVYMIIGVFVVEASTNLTPAALAQEFLPSVVVLALAIMLGEVVRGRRALAAETADRLRLASEEREAEAGRRVAEERLRIARELHDTVAHSMATITVQAGSALHLLGPDSQPADGGGPSDGGPSGGGSPAADRSSAAGSGDVPGRRELRQLRDDNLRSALTVIRQTSKAALTEMRTTLGQLRGANPDTPAGLRGAGLARLTELCSAVTAAGAPVSVQTEGEPVPLPPAVDHAAYRIVQESLTNVLRHAGPDARATVCLHYLPGILAITVADDGCGPPAPDSPADRADGHGLTGMAERAAAAGGELTAGAGPAGGFEVRARLPIAVSEPAR